MRHIILALSLLLASNDIWWSYDKDYQREDRYEQKDEKNVEIYDNNYNRKGHIKKEGDTWTEYDKNWNRVKTYKKQN